MYELVQEQSYVCTKYNEQLSVIYNISWRRNILQDFDGINYPAQYLAFFQISHHPTDWRTGRR